MSSHLFLPAGACIVFVATTSPPASLTVNSTEWTVSPASTALVTNLTSPWLAVVLNATVPFAGLLAASVSSFVVITTTFATPAVTPYTSTELVFLMSNSAEKLRASNVLFAPVPTTSYTCVFPLAGFL